MGKERRDEGSNPHENKKVIKREGKRKKGTNKTNQQQRNTKETKKGKGRT